MAFSGFRHQWHVKRDFQLVYCRSCGASDSDNATEGTWTDEPWGKLVISSVPCSQPGERSIRFDGDPEGANPWVCVPDTSDESRRIIIMAGPTLTGVGQTGRAEEE